MATLHPEADQGVPWFEQSLENPRLPWWVRLRLLFCATQTMRAERYTLHYKQWREVLYLVKWERDDPGSQRT